MRKLFYLSAIMITLLLACATEKPKPPEKPQHIRQEDFPKTIKELSYREDSVGILAKLIDFSSEYTEAHDLFITGQIETKPEYGRYVKNLVVGYKVSPKIYESQDRYIKLSKNLEKISPKSQRLNEALNYFQSAVNQKIVGIGELRNGYYLLKKYDRGEFDRGLAKISLADSYFLDGLRLLRAELPAYESYFEDAVEKQLDFMIVSFERIEKTTYSQAQTEGQPIRSDPKKLSQFSKGDLTRAEDEAKIALSSNPNRPIPHLLLGDVLFRRKEYERALNEYEIASRLDKTKGSSYAKIGKVCVKLRRYQQAEKALKTAIELEPYHPLCYLGLGIVHSRKYEMEKAIVAFKKSLSLDPNIGLTHFELGIAYWRIDRLEEAIIEIEKAVELEAANAEPKKILDRVKREKEVTRGFLTVEKDYLIIKYNLTIDQSIMNVVLESVDRDYQELAGRFSFHPKSKIIVKIYPNPKMYHLASSVPWWFRGGIADVRGYKMLLAAPTGSRNLEKFRETIKHEMTHIFTNLITYGNLPHWIGEGLAMYEASQWDIDKERTLRLAVLDKGLLTLEELRRPFRGFKTPQKIVLAYAESYSAVEFMFNMYGRDKVLQILKGFSRGQNFDEAAKSVLGISAKQFEKEWLDFIKGKYG